MAVYEYTALDSKGKKKKGIIDAQSLVDARERLRLQTVFPVSLSRVESADFQEKSYPALLKKLDAKLITRVKSSEITLVIRQLATLLSAGFPLVKAIATLIPQIKSNRFKRILSNVKDAVEEGSSFADALNGHPGVFSPVFVNMVKAGESSGTLEIVLERLADFSEKKEDTQKKIRAALAYPCFMAVVGFLVLFFLLTYIVPGITKIFVDMNHALPLPTRVLLSISHFLSTYWWELILLPPILLILFAFFKQTRRGGYFVDKILLRLPVWGNLSKKIIAARFSRTLGSLLGNGVPLLTALEISKSISGNRVISEMIEKTAISVEQGGALAPTLEKEGGFPDLAIQMIQVGEKSGELEKMLEKSADLFDREIQNTVTAATAVIEPAIILVMGIVIAFIILAVCLPIFEINQMIG